MWSEVSLRLLSPWAPQFRHIVFRDACRPRGRTVNAALAETRAPPSASVGRIDLSGEEEAFLEWLFHQAGLELRHYRLKTIKRRVPACLRNLRARTFAEARQTLIRRPSLLAEALSTLVIGVTSFFRDTSVFYQLWKHVIPQLMAGRVALKVWSIGCSDGAELYSLAIILSELKLLDRCLLLGTDCRSEAIRRARLGVYPETSLRDVPSALLKRYFFRRDEGWHLSPELKSAVTWRRADVLSVQEPGLWDMILCRNMSMYFSSESSLKLWPRLEHSLMHGGVLVLGKAERPRGSRRLTMIAPCIYELYERGRI